MFQLHWAPLSTPSLSISPIASSSSSAPTSASTSTATIATTTATPTASLSTPAASVLTSALQRRLVSSLCRRQARCAAASHYRHRRGFRAAGSIAGVSPEKGLHALSAASVLLTLPLDEV